MGWLNNQSTRVSRHLAIATVFLLPLGFIGFIGVAAGLLLLVVHYRLFSFQLYKLTLPFTVVFILSIVLNKPSRQTIVFAFIFLFLITTGIQIANSIKKYVSSDSLITGFLCGTNVLALSIVVDFYVGKNTLPSGLFFDDSLHNWSAPFFALGFPLSIYFMRLKNRRGLGAISCLLCVAGTVFALSWVGFLAIIIAAITLLIVEKKWRLSLLFVLLIGFVVVSLHALNAPAIVIRDYTFLNLYATINNRFLIFKDAIELALLQPFFGWGAVDTQTLYAHYVSPTYVLNSYQHFHNLFAQILVSSGIIGLLLFIYIFYGLFYLMTSETSLRNTILASSSGFLVTQFFDYSFHNASIAFAFFIITQLQSTPEHHTQHTPYPNKIFFVQASTISIIFIVFSVYAPTNQQTSTTRVLDYMSPATMSAGQQFAVFAGLETQEDYDYELVLKVCQGNCYVINQLFVDGKQVVWERLGLLTLNPGTYRLNLYALERPNDKLRQHAFLVASREVVVH